MPSKVRSFAGEHISMYNKSETYPVEAVKADERQYLARLGRHSRCFPGCIMGCGGRLICWCAAKLHGN
jgi:hypothetical protein